MGNLNGNEGEADSDSVKLQFSDPGGGEAQVDGKNGTLPLDQGSKGLLDDKANSERDDPPRSLCAILCQPVTITAVVSEMVGMFVMLLVMTATPIAMHGTQANSFNFPLEQTTLTIQIHIVCMFLPGAHVADISALCHAVDASFFFFTCSLVFCGISLATGRSCDR